MFDRSHRADSSSSCTRTLLAAAFGMLAWLTASVADGKPVRVVLDRNYPPYSFLSRDGQVQGILVDRWRAWEAKTGISVEFHPVEWSAAVPTIRTGECDVIASIVENADRKGYLEFGPAFATTEVPIYFRKEISGIVDLASARDFPVAVKEGDQHIALLRANGLTTLVPYASHKAIIEAAKERKIDVFIFDAPSALYYLHQAAIADDFRQSPPVFHDELRWAVRKGDAELARTIAAGFAALDPRQMEKINEKWFGRTVYPARPYLEWASYGITLVLLVVLGLLAWNWALRRQVGRRTRALHESEQRFRQIADNINDAFWLTSADLATILYANRAFERIWGRTPRQLDADSFLASVHLDDRARVTATMATNATLGFELEYRIVRPDRTVAWVRDRGSPIPDEQGRIRQIARITEDVTERKKAESVLRQAEHQVRQLIDTIPTGAWSVGADGRVDFLNRQWLDYAGMTLDEALADPRVTVHPDDVAPIGDKWESVLAAGQFFEEELRLRRADGVYRWFLVRTVPLRDEEGRIVKWFGVSIDIEDRKQNELSLRAHKRQLRALVERLHAAREEEAKRIARELHDDLGQQLTGLNLQLESLERSVATTSPAARTPIAGMRAMINRMITVVQDISTGLRLGQLDMLGLTAAIEWQLQEFTRHTGIACDPTQLDEITGLDDEQNTALFRILQEALTNVIRHAHATRIQVSLQASAEHVSLEVRDNGRGAMPAELLDRTAIGVLGMRERAETLGGDLTITAGLERGTTVKATLPRNRSVPERQSK